MRKRELIVDSCAKGDERWKTVDIGSGGSDGSGTNHVTGQPGSKHASFGTKLLPNKGAIGRE